MMKRRLRPGLAVLATLAASPVSAESFSAAYQATLAGFTIGDLRVAGTVGDAAYRVRLDGAMTLFGFTNRFDAEARGTKRDAKLIPVLYTAANDGMRKRTVSVAFSGNRAAETVEPEPEPSERQARVAVEAQHRVDVVDPLSALLTQLLQAGRTGDPCDAVARVFSGQSRFDVALEPSRIVAGEVVCGAKIRQISGHRRSGPPMGAPPAITVAFPIAGTQVVRLPARIELSLPVGTVLIRRSS